MHVDRLAELDPQAAAFDAELRCRHGFPDQGDGCLTCSAPIDAPALRAVGEVGVPLTVREDAALEQVEAIHEHLRDGNDFVEVRAQVATRAAWDQKPGQPVTGWSKRQVFRDLDGRQVAWITWECNDDDWRGGSR